MSEDLSFDSAVTIADGIRRKKYSSVEVATYFLNRINRLNSQTNSFTTITDDLALETARNLDAITAEGKSMGPLHGVPVGIKDLGDSVKGVRSTFGSAPMKDFIATETACYVQKLIDAGAIIVGKTNSPEFGHKGITDNYVRPAKNIVAMVGVRFEFQQLGVVYMQSNQVSAESQKLRGLMRLP